MRKRTSPEDRFWAKVNKNGPVAANRPELENCWVWTGALSRGYGQFWNGDQKQCQAHVLSYKWAVGPVPPRMQLDHFACDLPSCVRPSHVRPTMPRENTLRGDTLAAKNAAKTHCPKGHPYDPFNTMARSNGKRECKTCARDRERAKALSRH